MSYATQLRSLVDYNGWANERILVAADGVSDEEFARKGEDGLSIGNALRHAVRTQIWWLGNWTGADAADIERTREGLRRAYADAQERLEALVASTDDAGWERMVEFSFQPGSPLRLPLWQTVTQVMLHCIQHRAEAAVLLTRAGRSPGNLDYIIWLLGRG
jgi:uncharacterized damage-inducible protein DinB